MTLFGQGRAALLDDRATAERLGWAARRRSAPDPEIVLSPRVGDPASEPWITPPWFDPQRGVEALRSRAPRRRSWGYLAGAPGVARYLSALAAPRRAGGRRVGLAGLGRVGGVAATLLAASPAARSGIEELLVHDVDKANQERWLLELGSVAGWREGDRRPAVRGATVSEMLARCDAVLFAATESVPPLGARGDVRMVQFEPNRAILRTFVDEARRAAYTGMLLVVSDPIEWLAQAAFVDSNSGAAGRFAGDGLAPERIAGLGLGVMWARALAAARSAGEEERVARRGAAFGPHSTEVLAFDDLESPDDALSRRLTKSARECNFRVRELGHLPYVGPGTSSIALALPRLLAGRETLASTMLGGIYFGSPARLDGGVFATAHRMDEGAFATISALHERLRAQARTLGLVFRPRRS